MSEHILNEWERQSKSRLLLHIYMWTNEIAFGALTLFVECQEEHPACKN